MQFTFTSTPTASTVVRPLLQDDALSQSLTQIAVERGFSADQLHSDFKADARETLPLYQSTQTLFLLGLGKEPKSGSILKAFRTFFLQQKSKLPATVGLDLRGFPAEWIEWIVNGTLLGGYNLAMYKTGDQPHSSFFGEKGTLELILQTDEGDHRDPFSPFRIPFANGKATAETQLRIFDLMNAPANHKTPQTLTTWALDSGEKFGYAVRVLDGGEIRDVGLEALWAVSQGSKNEPAFLMLDYQGAPDAPVIGLVGKGVTFDTGGVSIKASTNMHLMKSDMGGAAAVLGTIELAARLRLPVRLVGIIPATENSVDGDAMKPGDVIGSYSGKTIEVTDTDAEGRLILADGLAYCLKNYQPEIIIDLATLTGNVIAALGYNAAGLFTTNDELARQLIKAGTATGERLWQLPLWDEYAEHLKSDIADVRNYSGIPHSGAIAAAKFLELFTDKHPAWAHLDIAGMAFGEADFAPQRAGTAFGVRLLVEWLKGCIDLK